MKKIAIIMSLLIGGLAFSQITIGKDEPSNGTVSLEFGEGDRGLALPMVDDKGDLNGPLGTMAFDLQDNRVYVKYASGWKDLSTQDGVVTNDGNHGTSDISIQTGKPDLPTAKVSIGEPVGSQNAADGILVLEDPDKAMVLPLVKGPDSSIANPAAGMMVYDPEKQLLALYNGEVWTYWRASE